MKRTGVAQYSAFDAAELLKLLPVDLPPYSAPCHLPNTPYRLEELIGMGGFGTVYRAIDPGMPYMPLAVKFCRDSSSVPVLKRKRDNLERLIQTGAATWSQRVIRLYGYNLEHPTPYLVYEWVPGGDLASLIANRMDLPTPEETLRWIRGIVEGLAFAHRHGIVHRDLKPSNILLAPDGVKLADFGIGGTVVPDLGVSATVSMLRGAGTPLYMAPEQRRGAAPDPRHDIYSVGVIWYQLLLCDCSRELHPGWEEELREEIQVPQSHLELIRRCVGVVKKRPTDAGELLTLLDALQPSSNNLDVTIEREDLLSLLRELHETHRKAEKALAPYGFYLFDLAEGIVTPLFGFFIGTIASAVCLALIASELGVIEDASAFVLILPILTGIYMARRIGRRVKRLRGDPSALHRSIIAQADAIVKAAPATVAAWGGRKVLLRSVDVGKIYRQLLIAHGKRKRKPVVRSEPNRPNRAPASVLETGIASTPKSGASTATQLKPVMLREMIAQFFGRLMPKCKRLIGHPIESRPWRVLSDILFRRSRAA